MEQFLTNPAQTNHQVIEAQVNGSIRNYLITAQKYRRDTLTVLVGIDITERKLAEEQLRQSETQLRFALNTACMGFWDWNFQTGKISYSDNLKRLYGLVLNTCEATQESLFARIHPDDCDRVYQANQRSLEAGEDSKIEFRVIWPDGSIHWLESKCQVFYDERDQPVRHTKLRSYIVLSLPCPPCPQESSKSFLSTTFDRNLVSDLDQFGYLRSQTGRDTN